MVKIAEMEVMRRQLQPDILLHIGVNFFSIPDSLQINFHPVAIRVYQFIDFLFIISLNRLIFHPAGHVADLAVAAERSLFSQQDLSPLFFAEGNHLEDFLLKDVFAMKLGLKLGADSKPDIGFGLFLFHFFLPKLLQKLSLQCNPVLSALGESRDFGLAPRIVESEKYVQYMNRPFPGAEEIVTAVNAICNIGIVAFRDSLVDNIIRIIAVGDGNLSAIAATCGVFFLNRKEFKLNPASVAKARTTLRRSFFLYCCKGRTRTKLPPPFMTGFIPPVSSMNS